MSLRSAFLPLAILSLLYGRPATAQDTGLNARFAGMGYSSVSLMNGVDALGVNPACITPRTGKAVSISLLPAGIDVGTDFADFSTYDTYFTGVENADGEREPYYLQTEDKNALLSRFHDGLGNFYANGSFTLVGVTFRTPIGSFGVNMTDHIESSGSIPREYAEFLLFGNPPGRTFDFSETRVVSSWTRDYGLSYARRIVLDQRRRQAISFGATVKYVHGFGYFGVDRFDSRFTTDPDSFVVTGRANMHATYAGGEFLAQKNSFAVSLFPAPAGSGAALDLGFLAEFSEMFTLGVSMTNLGYVQWNRTATEIAADEPIALSDLSTDEQYEAIKTALNGKEQRIGSFTTSLPAAVAVATSFTARRFLGINRPLHIALSARQRLRETPGLSSSPRVGLGAEWEFIPSLPLRWGVQFDDSAPAAFSFGFGLKLGFLTLDMATNHINTAFSNSFSRLSFAFSSHMDF